MTPLMEGLTVACALVFEIALATIPLALASLAVDAAFGRRLAPPFRCLLWTLVAVRLLVPYALPSSLSLHNGWRLLQQQGEQRSAEPYTLETAAANTADATIDSSLPGSQLDDLSVAVIRLAASATTLSWTERVLYLVPLIWFVGFATSLFRASIASLRFSRHWRSLPCVADPAVTDLLKQAGRQIGVSRLPLLKIVDRLSAPALFGVFRPTLCLPADTHEHLSDRELRMIMLHELMHLRRRDGLLAWLFATVQAVHWFNPVAWLAISRAAQYREQACDAAVRQFTMPTEHRQYANLLIRFAARRPVANLGLVGLCFARPARSLSTRIEAIAHPPIASSAVSRFVFTGLIAILVASGFTGAALPANEVPRPNTVGEWMAQPALGVHHPSHSIRTEPPAGPVETRTYDISQAINKLRELNPHADAHEQLMRYLTLPSLATQSVRPTKDNPDHLDVTVPRDKHESLARFLDSLARSGPWQVIIRTRILRAAQIEAIGDVDWQDAVKFALPKAKPAPPSPQHSQRDDSPGSGQMSVQVETTSWEYAPYLALVVDGDKTQRIVDSFQGDRRRSIVQAPNVTVFSGQRASLCDESFRPFVVGVHFVKGEWATAAQPDIAVLTEGMTLDVQPCVIDAGALELDCQLTTSKIHGVTNSKLPGQEVTVQTPRGTQRTISVRCRMAPGETLLLSPVAAADADEAPTDEDDVCIYAITAEWAPDASVVHEKQATPNGARLPSTLR